MEKVDTKKSPSKMLKVFAPALLVVLYFQGYAYHAGQLEPKKVNESLYPISTEQIFINAYFLYTNIISVIDYVIYTVIAVFVVMLLTSVIYQSKRPQESNIGYSLSNKTNKNILGFINKHKAAFYFLITMALVIYVSLVVVVSSIIPYLVGSKVSVKNIERYIKENRYSDVNYQNSKEVVHLKAIILQSSEKFVTILTTDKNVITIPMDQVISISSKL